MLAQSVLFTAVYSGVALNTDITKGVVDRFRSLPVWRPAPLVGAVVGDSARYVIAATIVIVLGFIMGFDAAGGALGVVAARRAGGRVHVRAELGVHHPRADPARAQRGAQHRLHGAVPARLPEQHLRRPVDAAELARGFVDINPISHLVTAVRELMAGTAEAGDVLLVLGEAAVLTPCSRRSPCACTAARTS